MKINDEMYIYIIKQYMLPLFPLHVDDEVTSEVLVEIPDDNSKKDSYVKWDTITSNNEALICLKFYSRILGEKKCFKAVFRSTYLQHKEQSISFLNSVWSEIITGISRINIPEKLVNTEQTKCYLKATCQTAVTIALVRNVIGSGKDATSTMLKIIQELESWSAKTYEGLKIPFGFIIDNSKQGEEGEDYTSFLESKHSALFTDGVFSAIELNSKGRIIQYIPLNSLPTQKDEERIPLCPTRFKHFSELCTNNKCGVMGLSNGDILIFCKNALSFAKRSGIWGKWGYNYFYSACLGVMELEGLAQHEKRKKEKLLKCVYNSIMDASFAHSGACFAIIKDLTAAKNTIGEAILDGKTNQKKAVIRKLISSSNGLLSFEGINEKLRTEMMGLDGAFVIDTSGVVIAVGAILAVPPGGDEGGRTAAAKALSNYGIGIKVSEDGDVTIYISENKILKFS